MYDVCDVILTFANQRFGKVCWHNVHIQGHRSSGREAVPSPRRAFCGLAPPKKAPRPQNWIMKHYKSVEFNQISEYQAPWTDVEPPIENFLAMVLLGRGAVKQLRTMETYKKNRYQLCLFCSSTMLTSKIFRDYRKTFWIFWVPE